MARFFVSCQLDLEKDLTHELESFWHHLIDLDGLPTRSRPEIVYEDQGGVEIECDLHLGLQINLFSKLANRVLWRIEKFEARYFDQFEKAIKKIDLQKHFGQNAFNVYIESAKSRLFHETNLLESISKVWTNAKIKTDENLCSLYIRIFKDTVTLSVDTSGQHLHRRGYRVNQGSAPIRETLAAKMYNFLLQQSLEGNVDYKYDSPQVTLLDPFCGSGTLLFESAAFFVPNLHTVFDFEKLNSIPALFKSNSWKKNYKIKDVGGNNFVGLEIDKSTFAKALLNLEIFAKIYNMSNDRFEFQNIDSKNAVSGSVKYLDAPEVYFIANPPYGERLKADNPISVLLSLESNINHLKGGVIVHPADWKFNFKNLKLKQSVAFNNQGINLKMSLFSN